MFRLIPEDRLLAGKPAAGRLTLSARQAGGEVLIAITDDGQGINRQRVRNINEFLTAMRGVDRAFQMSVVRGDFVLNFIVR